jgi:tRNA nucleotidyltransferase (CCA-adding enzyme)
MLFHDVAKPPCRTTDEAGQNHFKGHPQMGEQMTREILRRLKFDNDTIRMVSRLVLYHDERPTITDKSVRRIMSRYGEECFPLIFEVQRADVLAQSLYHRQEKLDHIADFEQQYRRILEAGQCFKKSDLAINGRDLIELGIPQGKQLGEVLDRLFEQVLDQPELNTREKLLELAHKMMPPFI